MCTDVVHKRWLAGRGHPRFRLARQQNLGHFWFPPPPDRGNPPRSTVSVNVSSASYPRGRGRGLPQGAITFKGHGELFSDEDTKAWFYRALSQKLNPDNKNGEEYFYNFLDSPLRVVLSVTPEKRIMYNAGTAAQHMAGTIDEDELGERLSSDAKRMNAAREELGLPPR